MHYSYEQGIWPHDPSKQHLIGRGQGLSVGDIAALKRLYPAKRLYPEPKASFSPMSVILQPFETEKTVTLQYGSRLSHIPHIIEPVGLSPGVDWEPVAPSIGDRASSFKYRIKRRSEFSGATTLRLRLTFDDGQNQELSLPITVSPVAISSTLSGYTLPFRKRQHQQAIVTPGYESGDQHNQELAFVPQLLQLNSDDDEQCLEALDDRHSWFWKRGERTVGMRQCQTNKPQQQWSKHDDGTIRNNAYADMCLAKAKWNDGSPVANDERSYAALQSCDKSNLQQKWLSDRKMLKNEADPSLALMQQNGTVVVEHWPSADESRFQWQWKTSR